MPRLLKYLKKSAWAIVAVLLLLVLQAYCEDVYKRQIMVFNEHEQKFFYTFISAQPAEGVWVVAAYGVITFLYGHDIISLNAGI